jgi:hypothetical protein
MNILFQTNIDNLNLKGLSNIHIPLGMLYSLWYIWQITFKLYVNDFLDILFLCMSITKGMFALSPVVGYTLFHV